MREGWRRERGGKNRRNRCNRKISLRRKIGSSGSWVRFNFHLFHKHKRSRAIWKERKKHEEWFWAAHKRTQKSKRQKKEEICPGKKAAEAVESKNLAQRGGPSQKFVYQKIDVACAPLTQRNFWKVHCVFDDCGLSGVEKPCFYLELCSASAVFIVSPRCLGVFLCFWSCLVYGSFGLPEWIVSMLCFICCFSAILGLSFPTRLWVLLRWLVVVCFTCVWLCLVLSGSLLPLFSPSAKPPRWALVLIVLLIASIFVRSRGWWDLSLMLCCLPSPLSLHVVRLSLCSCWVRN